MQANLATAISEMSLPRLLLLDDHLLIAQALSTALRDYFQIELATDTDAFFSGIESFRPDIAVLDVSIPGMDGFTAAQIALERWPDLRIVFLSMHIRKEYVEYALRIGAKAYLCKTTSAKDLVSSLYSVLDRNTVDSVVESVSVDQSQRTGLTNRQLEVLRLIADGATAKDIAHELHISVRTAEFHRASIMQRLELHSSAQLTRFAIEQNLVSNALRVLHFDLTTHVPRHSREATA